MDLQSQTKEIVYALDETKCLSTVGSLSRELEYAGANALARQNNSQTEYKRIKQVDSVYFSYVIEIIYSISQNVTLHMSQLCKKK